jgi:transposase
MSISSKEIRQRALRAFEEGLGSKSHIAKLYGISARSFRRWWQEYKKANKTEPSPRGHNPRALNDQDMDRLNRLLEQRSDMTLEHLRTALGKSCSLVTIHNATKRLNWRYKKNGACQRTKSS